MAPEGVHELHRQVRRLRLDLAVVERIAGDPIDPSMRSVDARLRSIARALGAVRDSDVMEEMLNGLDGQAPEVSADEVDAVLDHVRALRERRRAALGRLLRGAGTRKALEQVTQMIERPPPASEDQFSSALGDELARRHRRLKRALRKAHGRPSSHRLHQLRKEIRNSRDLLSEVGSGPEPAGGSPAVPLVRLQHRIGRLHDFDVLQRTIAHAPPRITADCLERHAVRSRRKWARRIHRTLSKKKVRKAVARFPPAPQ
jgi:CHAD domain-containing protein